MTLRVCLLVIAFATALTAQSADSSVEGKVVDSITGAPVKKAVVTLRNGNGRFVYFTAADQSGKYHIDNVQPEKYVATAAAEGYSNARSGEVKPITVSAGQQLTGVDIPIPPLSVITGRVTGDDGEPLDGVNVMALRYNYIGGTKTLQPVGSAQTNDLGQYRIFDLQPARYYLAAAAQTQIGTSQTRNSRVHSTVPEEAYAPAVYPGVPDVSQTAAHDVKPGAEWTGADFKLHKLPAYHIRGRINGAVLASGGRVNVQAEPCNPLPMPFGGLINMGPRQDGAFDLFGAVTGTYCLILREPTRGGVALRQPVTVKGGDVNDVILTPPEPVTLSGTIVFDGTPPDRIPTLGISLRTEDNSQQQHAQVTPDLTFRMEKLFPGRYTVVLSGPFYIKSMQYGGQDVSSGVISNLQDGGTLAIVLGTDTGEIDGTVQLGSLASGAPVTIALAPDDAHAERSEMYRFANSSAKGSFTLRGLPPGDYKLFALEGQNFEDAQNRYLLKSLEGKSTVVTVQPGGHEQAPLTPIAASEIERAKEKM